MGRLIRSAKFKAALGASIVLVGTALQSEITWESAMQKLVYLIITYVVSTAAEDVALKLNINK